MRQPDLTDVFERAFTKQIAGLRVAMPARIERYDAAKQVVDVAPALKERTENETGTFDVEALPILRNVPVQFPGGGGFALTFPVAVGDECLLIFSDRSLDVWKSKAGQVDPVDVRRHDLSDAVALLGVRSQPNKLAQVDTTRAVFGNKGPRVAADGTTLHLGVGHNEAAAQAAVLGTKYTTDESTMLTAAAAQMNALAAQFSALAAAAVGPLAPLAAAFGTAATASAGVASQFTSFAAQQASRLSTVVKVK